MKSPLKSKTIWGLILIALPQLFNAFGIEIFNEAEAQEVSEAFATIFGFALAVWGRITAKVPLKVIPAKEDTEMLMLWCLLGIAVLFGGTGCMNAAGFQKPPKDADVYLSGIRAKTLTATMTAPGWQISIQAEDFDSKTEASGATWQPAAGEKPSSE